jgi:hypothetical protein
MANQTGGGGTDSRLRVEARNESSLELISAVDRAESARRRSTLTPVGAAWVAITALQKQRSQDLPPDVTVENIVALLRARA